MKPLKGVLSNIVLTFLFVFSLILIARDAFAQDLFENEKQIKVAATNYDDGEPNDGTIEVIYAPQYLAPYKERYSDWGITAGINYSEFYPDKFRSKIDNLSYDQLFDSYPMDLIQGEFGVNYNTAIGSFGIGASIGVGTVAGKARINGVTSGGPRDLKIYKYAVSGTYALNMLFEEPYVVPYASGQVFTLDWEENDTINGTTKTGSTAIALGVTAGLLVQLNWLDSNAALYAQTTSGLDNAFLDLFVTQYNTSNDANDPNFETEMNVGAGVKLEF